MVQIVIALIVLVKALQQDFYEKKSGQTGVPVSYEGQGLDCIKLPPAHPMNRPYR